MKAGKNDIPQRQPIRAVPSQNERSVFLVPSTSGPEIYRVDLEANKLLLLWGDGTVQYTYNGECDCPRFQKVLFPKFVKRGMFATCKHIDDAARMKKDLAIANETGDALFV